MPLKEILSQKFDLEKFKDFAKNFLPNQFEIQQRPIQYPTINGIEELIEIGKIDEDFNLKVLVAKHNRTVQSRITLTKSLFQFMRTRSILNVLVALYSPDSNQWRLSLLTSELKLEGNRIVGEFSNPRRFSYVLGEGAKTKTPEKQLKNKVTTLEELKNRFSLEVLTNEFYDSLLTTDNEGNHKSGLYLNLYSSIKLPSNDNLDDKKDFALLLIGRLMFCWFLKEKGWIPKEILSSQHELLQSDDSNYYHQILEPLFFESLNKEKENRDYSNLLYQDYKAYFAQIPYLNGGLFEPRAKDYYYPNNINTLKVPNQQIKALLELFETYHFTIDEITSIDQEIGVDPEMMGRIFENFILNRSSTGSFYTPRKIVDYMVETSLKEYLKTKNLDENIVYNLFNTTYFTPTEQFQKDFGNTILEHLNNLKILDPACGSGAFPVGILQKLTEVKHILEPNKSSYQIKKEILQNNIYGVDILSIAVEISRLRCWLSLVVDEENNNPEPLPNLEFKFVCADSLIGIQEAQGLENPEIEKLREDLKNIRQQTFQSGANKQELQDRWQETSKKLFELQLESGFYDQNATNLTAWNPFENQKADFFDPQWMFGVKDGFDIVIGNPPYIQLQKDGGKLAELYEKQNFQTFTRTGDIYALFYENGINLLKDKGILCYITSNKWMRARYGEKLRAYFLQYNPLILIDLGPGIFESATVDTNILVIQKTNSQNRLQALTLQKDTTIDIAQQLSQKGVILNKLSKDAWFIGSSAEQELKEKIERIGKPLKNWDVKIYYGIKTGLNEAFIIDSQKREEILNNCKTEEERKRTEAIIKPILRGRDIKRYYYEWAGLWVIVIPAGWTDKNRVSTVPEKFISEYFPSLMRHLKPFEEKAKKHDDQGDYWWELRHCSYYPEFEKEKIFFKAVGRNLTFSIIEPGIMVTAPASFLTGSNLKYILGFLCSSFTKYFVENNADKTGAGDIMLNVQSFEKIPTPPITASNQSIVAQIEALVDKILAEKKENPQADTSTWEKEIDELVYRLYGLTEKEVQAIEKLG